MYFFLFGRWVKNFSSSGKTFCAESPKRNLRIQLNPFVMNNVFHKLYVFLVFWRWEEKSRLSGIKFQAELPKLSSSCPLKPFVANNFLIVSLTSIWDVKGTFLGFLLSFFWRGFRNRTLRVEKNTRWKKLLWKKLNFFHHFRKLIQKFLFFNGNFSAELSKLQFKCPEEQFQDKIFFWEGCIYL